MVFAAKRSLCARVPLNLSRPLLCQAVEKFQSGDIVSAGCRLREAIRKHIIALCEVNEVKVKGKRPSTAAYVKALLAAKLIDKWCADTLFDILDTGNKAAHLKPVKPSMMECSIAFAFSLMDDGDIGDYPRCPFPGHGGGLLDSPRDDDDFDPCDWWKKGGGA